MARDLPYDFDLNWDIKTMEQVEHIAAGEADSSEATPRDLIAMFLSLDMPIPECLNKGFDIPDITDRLSSYARDVGSDRRYYTMLMAVEIIKAQQAALEQCNRASLFYARVEEASKEERLAVGTDHHTMVHDACKNAAAVYLRGKPNGSRTP